MSEAFDPYYTWLAIPPEEQPPNHYRLLGLRLFEEKTEVIDNAADQRMAHLRSIQKGNRVEQAQQILNEISAARVALLNPERKQEYDAALRAELQAKVARPKAVATPPAAPTAVPSATGAAKPPLVRQPGVEVGDFPAPPRAAGRSAVPSRVGRGRAKSQATLLGAAAAGIVLLAVGVAWYVVSGAGADASAETALVFDLPKDDREGLKITVNEQLLSIPKSGPLVHACRPDEYQVRAVRAGFKPFEASVKLKKGDRKTVALVWQAASHLIIEWPAAERSGALLLIDGNAESLAAARGDAQAVRVTVDPGRHMVRIERRGYRPYEKIVEVLEGDTRSVRPSFEKSTGPDPGPSPSDVAKEKPKAEEPGEKPGTGQQSRKLLPVPAEAVRQEIGRKLDDVYRPAEADTAAAKVALAQKMLGAEEKYRQSPDERYVLLRRALDLAAAGGDAELMLKTADAIAADYAVEALILKTAGVKGFAAAASSAAQFESLLKNADVLIDQAMGAEKYDLAVEMIDRVYEACSRSHGKAYRKQAFDRRTEVQRAVREHDRFLEALKIIEAAPDDPEANTTAGVWRCVKRGDWDKGLPHLAKGTDATVKAVAERELKAKPENDEQQVALADAWWDLAQSRKGEERNAWLLRAGHWYKLAAAGTASAILKDKIAQRLPAIDRVEPPPGAAAIGQPARGERLRAGQWVDLLPWIDVGRDRLEGEWTQSKDGLRADSSTSKTAALAAPVAVKGSYDLQVEFTAAKGPKYPAAIGLPIGDRACTLVLFGWGGKISGLEMVDGRPADRNFSTMPVEYKDADRYAVEISVRLDGERVKIATTVGGTAHVAWEGNASAIAPSDRWRFAEPRTLGLGNAEADTTFHALRLRPVTGDASFAPPGRAAGPEK